MCTPTRAGLMTGRYPIRYGLMRSVIPPYRGFGLDPNEIILPEMLAEAGYEHRACIGKWHLGHLRKKWHPNSQGFTYFAGCYNGAIDYFTKVREGEADWHRNSQTIHADGYVIDIIADEAVGFINSVPDKEPYFLYVPFTAPHSPYQAKEEDIAKYPHREGKQRIYAEMVDCMDQAIGRIIDAVEKRGDRDNTFIF
ncbi:sulfatase-like hydrolase/transferase [Maribellus maritimus]|uniref:sulfatase-like hydrolase/transferase n=1 Tax=Maribellus maritimus TaxID=2870838 RepID=UPI0021D45D10|nr:sulfatase-like hydrolase/transferase [Maribellus maritimus]